MKIGKISEPILKRSVLKSIKYKNSNVLLGAAPGRDSSITNVASNDGTFVSMSTSTSTAGMYLTYTEDNFEFECERAVISCANNVAASGYTPVSAHFNLMLPLSFMESDLKKLMQFLDITCSKVNIQIAGGDTQVSDKVNTPLVTVVVQGKKEIEGFLPVETDLKEIVKPDMDIVMSKYIGISGTNMIIKEKYNELVKRFQRSYIDLAIKNCDNLSILKEAAVAGNLGVKIMHDVSHGGIFSALWELGELVSMGIEVNIEAINIKQETIEICEQYAINPYGMISDGALLMVYSDGEALVDELRRQGIEARIIGKIKDSNDKVVVKNDERRYLGPPKGDEIFKLFIKELL